MAPPSETGSVCATRPSFTSTQDVQRILAALTQDRFSQALARVHFSSPFHIVQTTIAALAHAIISRMRIHLVLARPQQSVRSWACNVQHAVADAIAIAIATAIATDHALVATACVRQRQHTTRPSISMLPSEATILASSVVALATLTAAHCARFQIAATSVR